MAGAGGFLEGLVGGITTGQSIKRERSIFDMLEKSGNQQGTSFNPAAQTPAPDAQMPTRPRSREQGAPPPVDAGFDPSKIDPAIASGLIETAGALGVDPVDVATAISYETAGTFDPLKKGPTTQWGRHQGLIQFGEPQARQYGVDWKNPIKSQLGKDGAVAKYLRNAGVKPGMGMLDIYSAINAGSVGRYNASDANNGGAPGTVRDKVEGQMAAHRAKAQALIGHFKPSAPEAGPQAPATGEDAPVAMRAARSIFGPESNAEQLLRRFYKPKGE